MISSFDLIFEYISDNVIYCILCTINIFLLLVFIDTKYFHRSFLFIFFDNNKSLFIEKLFYLLNNIYCYSNKINFKII